MESFSIRKSAMVFSLSFTELLSVSFQLRGERVNSATSCCVAVA
jgi:hypothetical protein